MPMQYTETTAAQAVLHFAEHVFPTLFKGDRQPKDREYKRVYSIIRDAKAGKVSEARARALLEKYGGGLYRVTVRFEIASGANGPEFGQAADEMRALNNENDIP